MAFTLVQAGAQGGGEFFGASQLFAQIGDAFGGGLLEGADAAEDAPAEDLILAGESVRVTVVPGAAACPP
ncbi:MULTISPECIES: hypothetical protein [unclassified Streptomyces]|uniref:hypothetical protein n=1 Tax=unclassified Streptomyces TaxID=2593676 RepID=UPI00380F228D